MRVLHALKVYVKALVLAKLAPEEPELPEVAYFEDYYGNVTEIHRDDIRLAIDAEVADEGENYGKLSRAAKFGPYTAQGIRTIITIAQDYGDDVEMALIAIVAHTAWDQDQEYDEDDL